MVKPLKKKKKKRKELIAKNACNDRLVTPECPKPIPDGPRIYRSSLEWSLDLERPRRKQGLKARARVTLGLAPRAYDVCIAAGP